MILRLFRTLILAALVVAPLLVSGAGSGRAVELNGYDVTAYTLRDAARRGSDRHAAEWQGRTYHFASAGAREAFVESPERFVPQYRGFDAYGVYLGEVRDANPRVWVVDDGKVYLFSTNDRRDAWLRGARSHRIKADNQWPRIEARLEEEARRKQDDADARAAALNQDCEEAFAANFSKPELHEVIVSRCAAQLREGNPHSMELVARVYSQTLSPLHDFARAVDLLQKATARGSVSAMRRLGDMYLDGRGVDADPARAAELYRAAAARGETSAMIRLAQRYETGTGAPRDLVKAWAWLNLAAADVVGAGDKRDRLGNLMNAAELSAARIESLVLLQKQRR